MITFKSDEFWMNLYKLIMCVSIKVCLWHVFLQIFNPLSGFKLEPDSREKSFLPPGKLGRSDSHIGRSYSAKLWHFPSV